MSNVWDFVNSINTTKKDMMSDTENDSLAEKDYVPFMVNKSLSYFVDTILYSNEINKYPFLDKKMQYTYYLHAIPKGKRFCKWSKKEITEDLEAISEYFQCNYRKSAEILRTINKSDLALIKQVLQKGGVHKNDSG